MPLNTTPNWPGTGLDSLPDPTSLTYQDDDGFEEDLLLKKHNAILEALEARLGSTVVNFPGRGRSLIGSGADGGIWDTNGRKNRLVNGSFRVNQRGASVGTIDNSYVLDRWRMLLEAANAATAAQETSDVPTDGGKRACKLTVGSGNNNKFGIFQALEFADCSDLRGKPVSLQFRMKATAGITNVRAAVVEWVGTIDSGASADPISVWGADGTNPTLVANWSYDNVPVNLNPTTGWASYYIENISVSASANNLAVFIWCDDKTTTGTTDVLRITDVQLEEGAVCTAVERRPLQAEEALCFSWLWVATAENVGLANAGATTLLYQDAYNMPVPMRTTPSMSSGTSSASTGAAGTLAFSGTTRRGGRIFNSGSAWTGNAVISITATFSAEL